MAPSYACIAVECRNTQKNWKILESTKKRMKITLPSDRNCVVLYKKPRTLFFLCMSYFHSHRVKNQNVRMVSEHWAKRINITSKSVLFYFYFIFDRFFFNSPFACCAVLRSLQKCYYHKTKIHQKYWKDEFCAYMR